VLHYDFEESVGYWLTVTTQLYHRALQAELAPHGITFRQAQVLGWLAVDGELSQSELACKMMVEPPTIVGILDRMERDGLILRRHCTNDRRKKWITSTPKAEPMWEQIIECAQRVRQQSTDGFTDRQKTTLKNLLTRVHENLSIPLEQKQT